MESTCRIRAGNVRFFSVNRPLRGPNRTTETNREKTKESSESDQYWVTALDFDQVYFKYTAFYVIITIVTLLVIACRFIGTRQALLFSAYLLALDAFRVGRSVSLVMRLSVSIYSKRNLCISWLAIKSQHAGDSGIASSYFHSNPQMEERL